MENIHMLKCNSLEIAIHPTTNKNIKAFVGPLSSQGKKSKAQIQLLYLLLK